ncbi:MAG: class I SAM-dependent methyltransferase [Candidatus Humimicrobiaceae bacterium]
MDQKKIYNHVRISKDYARRDYLDSPESKIIEELRDVLPKFNMLDMGVGGGRTTRYFLPLVNSYIGADYAPNMIAECKKKFKNKKIFEVLDVRNMSKFSDNMFDFILFSYNGIDSFGLEDRETALKEIKRVLRNDGYFSFSTHNINWHGLSDLFTIKNMFKRLTNKTESTKNPFSVFIIFFKSVFINLRLNFQNKSFNIKNHIDHLRKEGYGCLIDNSLNGKASIFYTSYKSQIQQLKKLGFKNITAYSVNGIKTEDESELNKSGWIYYLCRLEK